MDSLYFFVAFGAILAAFVQGLTGFGFGLVAMTFWSWVIDPRLAAVLVVYGSLQGQIINAFNVREGFDVKFLLPFLSGGIAGIPLGVYLLPHLDMLWLKTLLGCLLISWCPLMLINHKLPNLNRRSPILDSAVGFVGGVLGGIGGFTGPANALWTQIRRYPKAQTRALIQHFNLSVLLVTFISYLATGIITPSMWPMILLIAPLMLIPALLGGRVYRGTSEAHFRQWVLVLLTLSGAVMLASSLPNLLSR